jgi:superfamily I DNA/RNA helicase
MNAQSRLLEENFRRLRIPYRLVGGRSFFERREIKDLTAYMAVFLNPSDDASLLRIINSPPRGIGAATVELALSFSVENNHRFRHCTPVIRYLQRKMADAILTVTKLAARVRIQTPGVAYVLPIF